MIMILVIALLALLPLLAYLQYRWLGDVSVGERDRMRANLRAMSAQFVKEFNHELTNIYFRFRPAPVAFWSTSADPTPMEKLLTQSPPSPGDMVRQWVQTTKHPELIDAVYQAKLDRNGSTQISKLNRETNQLEPCDWPKKLGQIRHGLEMQHDLASVSESQSKWIQRIQRFELGPLDRRIENRMEAQVFRTTLPLLGGPVPPLFGDIPAVVAPQHLTSSALADFGAPPATIAYNIITLNLDYIKNEYLPQLAKQCFASGGKDDYLVTVIDRAAGPETLYKSDPKAADLSSLSEKELAASDVATRFFALNPEELDFLGPKVLIQQGSKKTEVSNGVGEKQEHRVSIGVIESSEKSGQTPEKITEQAASGVARTHEAARPLIVKMLISGAWELIVRHRAGSLEAAVEHGRRRNLAISFGILLLLGGSMGLIILLSQRTQRLADRQMEFVAGVSHELRTPLAVICSAAENLADGVIDNREQIKRYGGLIRDEGRRLGGMVEQVLEFAGAQSGRKTYELRPEDLRQIVNDAIAACHLQVIEGGFEIETRFPNESLQVQADAPALGRAIQNLLNNAMKYSGESRWIGLFVEKKEHEILIKVSDRGVGVRAAEIARIFEPFYRGKEATEAQIHGNGLGLSLVKHIVEAHDGKVTMESKVGQGSVFTLRLPVAINGEQSQIEPALGERAI
jgi:signal transduction histidine kinase